MEKEFDTTLGYYRFVGSDTACSPVGASSSSQQSDLNLLFFWDLSLFTTLNHNNSQIYLIGLKMTFMY